MTRERKSRETPVLAGKHHERQAFVRPLSVPPASTIANEDLDTLKTPQTAAMPLDGHAYLVSQGWEGRGTGLRQGAIAKPVTLVQKKTLSGVGKDRDDAFPFWDQ